MDELQEWITTRRGAELSGYNIKYLRWLIHQGRVSAKKLGRDWLVNRESLLAYKARMDALGPEKHNPWRDDLAQGAGRAINN